VGVTRITNKIINRSAIEALEEALEKAKSGEIQAVAISGYLKDGNVYRDVSDCNSACSLQLYTAIAATAQYFYNNIFDEE